jgi:hypothetical protein
LQGIKHYTIQNVPAAVDFDMTFTYALAEWEGSAQDATILADGQKILEVKFYLAHAGYAPMLAALVFSHPSGSQGTTSMSSLHGSTPRIPKNFSILDTSLRVTVERAFVALKNRF